MANACVYFLLHVGGDVSSRDASQGVTPSVSSRDASQGVTPSVSSKDASQGVIPDKNKTLMAWIYKMLSSNLCLYPAHFRNMMKKRLCGGLILLKKMQLGSAWSAMMTRSWMLFRQQSLMIHTMR